MDVLQRSYKEDGAFHSAVGKLSGKREIGTKAEPYGDCGKAGGQGPSIS